MWRCGKCGETVDDDFDVCWSCCAVREAVCPADDSPESEDASDANAGNNGVPQPAISSACRPHDSPQQHRENLDGLFVRDVGGWVRRRSCASIALAVQALFWLLPIQMAYVWWNRADSAIAFASFGIALFIPRAIQQWNWRHLAWMGTLGAVAPFLVNWGILSFNAPDSFLTYRLIWTGSIAVLIGVGEWLFAPGNSWKALLWLIAALIGACCLQAVVAFLQQSMSVMQSISAYCSTGLLALLIWLAVPLGFRCAGQGTRTLRAVTAAAVFTSAVCYVVVFAWGLYWLAAHSLDGRGLFSQKYAVQLLAYRGRQSDFDAILKQLEAADWSAPLSYPPNTYLNNDDWRYTAVRLLIRHDPERAAEHLSRLLRERPSRQLIDMTEGLFVEYRRYETVPIYMRYALTEGLEPSMFAHVGDDRYKIALQELGVPQVVKAWLSATTYSQVLFAAIKAREESRPLDIRDEDLVVGKKLKKRMMQLMKVDAGDRVVDWEDAYEKEVHRAPTPLSDSLRQETDRVLACFAEYEAANNRWHAWRSEAKGKKLPVSPQPAEPDWDAPTIDLLEQAVSDYVGCVNRVTLPEVPTPNRE